MNDINYLQNNGVNANEIISTLGIETYNEIIQMFLEEIKEKVDKLNEFLNSNNMKDYATYVHGIKGEANYLGFTKLGELAYNHQLKSQEGDIEFIKNNYISLIEEINRMISVARTYLGIE